MSLQQRARPGSSKPSRVRRTLLVLGAVFVAIALGADFIGLGGSGTGFGQKQTVLLVLGASLLVPALAVPDRFFANLVLKPLLLVGSLYFTLVLCNLALGAFGPKPQHSGSVKGLYVRDDDAGYRLASSFSGVDDDGHVRVTYQTNSRGHRDDEPGETTRRRVLLIGDSYTFGLRLGPEDTIDKQIERLSNQGINAYNTGVPGYGPPSILATLKRSDWLPASDVVYFFYKNDLTTRELDAEGRTCRRGHVVPRVKPDGTPYTEDELLYEVARAENPPLRDRLEAMLRLENITRLVRRFRPREVQVPAENVELAADFTEQMRDVAEARNMRFLVVIIPTLHDLRADRHGESIERYVSSLESRNVAILDLLGVVGLGDYYLEEGHFNPTGAKTVARATLERLQ